MGQENRNSNRSQGRLTSYVLPSLHKTAERVERGVKEEGGEAAWRKERRLKRGGRTARRWRDKSEIRQDKGGEGKLGRGDKRR